MVSSCPGWGTKDQPSQVEVPGLIVQIPSIYFLMIQHSLKLFKVLLNIPLWYLLTICLILAFSRSNLAIKWALEALRYYLLGAKFIFGYQSPSFNLGKLDDK